LEIVTYLANKRKIENHFKPRGIKPLDFEIIAAILLIFQETGPVRVRLMCDKIGYIQNIMYPNMMRLVKKGYLEKHKSQANQAKKVPGFGPVYLYTVTGKGWMLMEEYDKLTMKYLKE
jgi:DNA-binding MarR family transcriptional regulator